MIATRFSGRADRYTEQDESRTRAMPNDRVQLRPPRRLLAASAAVCTKTQKLLRVKELDPRVCVIDVFSVDSVLIPASPHSPRFTDHCPLSSIPFLFTFLWTLLRSRKTQLFCFQSIPNSLPKTPGVGYTYLWLLSLIGRSLRTGRGVSLSTLPFSTFNCRLSTSSVPFFSCQPHLLFWKAKNERQPFMAATKRHTKEDIAPVSHATVSAHTVKRVFNFNAGPGTLPLPVLERIREELLDWRGSGMSVMEMSHRSPEFESINAAAEQKLRSLLGISDDYAVIFIQGGGSLQFSMVPMNLCLPGKPVDVLHTGMWTAKAIGELKKGVLHNIAASTEPEKFARLPRREEMNFSPEASYVHLCTNNTIEGTQWTALPETGPQTGNSPIVADMSSDIASRPVDVKKYGLIFAGAQKNLGPSGVTVVIIRRDLAERADKNLPTLLQYRTHIKEKSLYHTPPAFAVYIVGLVLEWIASEGGIQGMENRNAAKAGLLYGSIESSGEFYSCPVEKASRSKMNVVFRVAGGNESIEKKFSAEAAAAGLVGTPGHRSVGGMRVSLYNAVTLEAVEALTSFMREFQRARG